MEWSSTEVLPVARTLPAELPRGGLNQGPYLVGVGATQHFNWHKHVVPAIKWSTSYGIKHKFVEGGHDHQDILFNKGVKGDGDKIRDLKLKDKQEDKNSSEVWEATQDHVWGLRRDRREPFVFNRFREDVGMETGWREAGLEAEDYKTQRAMEFAAGTTPYKVDANRVDDGRVADHNRAPADDDAEPAIRGSEEVSDMAYNERRAVRVV